MKMKTLKFILPIILMMVITACEDDAPDLGAKLDASQIDFDVIQDLVTDPGGNTVILKNNTPGTVAMWDYGTGRSNRTIDTVRFAFKGDYEIKFSAVTRGGIVVMDPVNITVTDDNVMYVNDPMWTALSGGVGNSKTWLLDVDADGVSKYFKGPVYFSGNDIGVAYECLVEGSAACWYWEADLPGNPWIGDPGDYGTMTFSLDGGPFINVEHKMIPTFGEESGTYFLNTNNGTITITDAHVLQNSWANNDVGNWNNAKIISLDENTMQLAFQHKTKAEFMIFNYISKEYSDNWVPDEPDGDPNFDFGDQGEILTVSNSKTWKLDLQVPYNWTNLNGDFLNNWSSRSDIIATGWAPFGDGDVQNIDDAAISFGADGSVTVKQDNGTTASGTFDIDEDTNMITFDGVSPNIPIASWVSATTTDLNQWKIVKVERSPVNDVVTGLWFGKRDPAKDEYMVFHFVQR
jgi:hypothetical protein